MASSLARSLASSDPDWAKAGAAVSSAAPALVERNPRRSRLFMFFRSLAARS